jgi:hypothetical protein
MFHTIDSGRATIPKGLMPAGMQVWRWVDLSQRKPYFFAFYEISMDHGWQKKQTMFAMLDELLELCNIQSEELKIHTIAVLCPDYLLSAETSQTFRLIEVSEIWRDPEMPYDELYIAKSGDEIRYCLAATKAPANELERVVSMKELSKKPTNKPS